MLKASELLERAKAKISNPDSWIQGTYAQNAEGMRVGFSNAAACKFCSEGALLNVCVEESDSLVLENQMTARRILDQVTGHTVAWNDAPGRSHSEVMEMFDEAIAIAKAGEVV